MKTEQLWRTTTVDSSEILRCRRILLVQRDEAMRSLDRLGDETRSLDSDCPKDVGDLCTTNLSKEALFQQTDERRLMVRMIDAALARIQQGIFGVCAACGEDINLRRLDALPWTQYCLRCQRGFEEVEKADRRVSLKKAG
jgi:DnaK suppressor protein